MAKVSVIIPCFNQGHFLDDAVKSVLAQTFTDFEIIIVNDGSTDDLTHNMLQQYHRPKTRVVSTSNQGLAAARNNGIAVANGQYILPLDADDLIDSRYLEKAVAVLDENPDVGIVYCQARLFGAVETDWIIPEYSLERMLIDNIIFCSAFFRKDDWRAVGGFDSGMIYGWEDYEFWLSLIEKDRRVVQLPGQHFFYRVASDSMVRSKEKWQKVAMFQRIYQRHTLFFSKHIAIWIDAFLDVHDKYYTSRLYVDCGQGLSDQSSVGRKIERGTRRIVFNLGEFFGIKAIRFDPVDTCAVIKIARMTATYRSGRNLEIVKIQSNALYDQDGKLFFDSRDPQCFFPDLGHAELADIIEVTVELEFFALADAALELIVQHQKAELQSRDLLRQPGKIKHAGKVLLQTLTGGKNTP